MVTLQVQSVLCQSNKAILLRDLDSLANSVRVAQESSLDIGEVSVVFGEARQSTFSDAEIASLSQKYGSYFHFRCDRWEEEIGFSKGHNLLAKSADADYLLILHPEAIVSPQLISVMLKSYLKSDNPIGILEARQTPVELPKAYNEESLETDWATMICSMIPTASFLALNGFDELFAEWGSDVDFSWRMRSLGKTVCYRPDAVVFLAKRPNQNGELTVRTDEDFNKMNSALLLSYKWSGNAYFDSLCERYRSNENGKKALANFERLKAEGLLPTPLDTEHRIAKFAGDRFAEERYVLRMRGENHGE